MSGTSWGLAILATAGFCFWLAWMHWSGRTLTEYHPDGLVGRGYAMLAWYGLGFTIMGVAFLAYEVGGWLEVPSMWMLWIGGLFGITGLSLAPWLLRRHRPGWQRAQVAWVRQQEASDDPVPWWDRPDEVRFGSISRAEERGRRASHVGLSDLRGALEDGPSAAGDAGSGRSGSDRSGPPARRPEAGPEQGSDGPERR